MSEQKNVNQEISLTGLQEVTKPLVVNKVIPKVGFMQPSTKTTILKHLFNLDGSVTVSDEKGNDLTISPSEFGFANVPCKLYYDSASGIVQYVFSIDKDYSVNAVFEFNKLTDRVKITIKGSLPEAATLKIPITTTNRLDLLTKTSASSKNVGFDWSDITVGRDGCTGVSWDSTNNQLIVNLEKNFSIDPYFSGINQNLHTLASYGYQRTSFYANSLFWTFGFRTDGNNGYFGYWTSSNANNINFTRHDYVSSFYSSNYAVWFDGTYVHYVRWDGNNILYRKGTPNSDATITWVADEQTAVPNACPCNPAICTDSNGYAWISYYHGSGNIVVLRSGNNDGTWGTNPSGFPYSINVSAYSSAGCNVVPLTSGKVAIVYNTTNSDGSGNKLSIKVWSGSSWSSTVSTTNNYTQQFSAITVGDTVQIAAVTYATSPTYQQLYWITYSNGTITNETSIRTFHDYSNHCAAITLEATTGNFRVFTSDYSPASTGYSSGYDFHAIYYNGTAWSDEIPKAYYDLITEATQLTSSYSDYGGYMTYVFYARNASWQYSYAFGFYASKGIARILYDGYDPSHEVKLMTYYNSLHWLFYSDVNPTSYYSTSGKQFPIYYKTSSDGVNWSAPSTLVSNCFYGSYAVMNFDGTYCHYAYTSDSKNMKYRRFSLNSDGTITFSASEQTVLLDSNNALQLLTICKDSNSKIWVLYSRCDGGDGTYLYYGLYCSRAANTDGTWGSNSETTLSASTMYEFPQLWNTAQMVALTSGKLFAWMNSSSLSGYWYYNGTTWSSAANFNFTPYYAIGGIAKSGVDLVHLAYCGYQSSVKGIYYREWTPSGGLTSPILVYNTGDNVASNNPVLSEDPATNNLWLFWSHSPTNEHIYYKKRIGGTWDTNPTDLTTDVQMMPWGNGASIWAWPSVANNQIAIAYLTGLNGPDNIMYKTTLATTITASADANSSISPSGVVQLNVGSNQAFTYSANIGYHVTQVLVDGNPVSITGSYTFTNVQTSHSIAVSSAINTYAITVSADANSTVSPSGTIYVNYGGNQTYTISANATAGYHISNVNIDGIDQGPITTYTFSNVQATHAVTVTSYIEVGNLIVDSNATVTGYLTVLGGSNVGGCSGFITSIAQNAPLAVTNGALSLNSFAHTYICDWNAATGTFLTNVTPSNLSGSGAIVSGWTIPWSQVTGVPGFLTTVAPSNLSGSGAIAGGWTVPWSQITGLPSFTSTWQAGTVTELDPNYFSIVETSPNTISRVTFPTRGTASNSATITMSVPIPTAGNLLVLVSGVVGYQAINSITQTNVTWTSQAGYYNGISGNCFAEIWVGVVGSSPGSTLTIVYAGSNSSIAVDVCEYSGLRTTNFLDSVGNPFSLSGSPSSTGQVSTSHPNELIVAAIVVNGNANQSWPQNGFTCFDAQIANNLSSTAYLDYMTTRPGIYSSGTTTNGGGYSACIISLIAAQQTIQNQLTFVGSVDGSGGSLSASLPLQLSNNQLSITQANGSTNGYLASSDWNTFNNKQNALTIGNLNGTSNQVNVSSGTGVVIGSGVTLSLPQSIHTGASPTFAGLTINGNPNTNNLNVTAGLTFNGNAGTAGQVLTSSGSGNPPSWQSPSTGSGGSWSASPVSSVGAGVRINGTQLQLDPTYSPTFSGLLLTDLVATGHLSGPNLMIGANTVITSDRVLQNVTTDASIVTSGTFASARLPSNPTFAGLNVSSVYLNYNSGQGQIQLRNTSEPDIVNAYITRWNDRLEICEPAMIRVTRTVNGTPALAIDTSDSTSFGQVTTVHNMLDDGSGKMTITGGITANNILENLESFPHLTVGTPGSGEDTVYNFLFSDTYNNPSGGSIKFTDSRTSGTAYNYLSGALFSARGPDEPSAPAIACSHHLIVRKDFLTRGQVESYEGIVSLHGGYAGWAPTSNPMVFLREASVDLEDPTGFWKNTLEIRHYINGWGWGNLECGEIYAHGIIHPCVWANVGTVPLYKGASNQIGYNQSTYRVKQNISNLTDCSWLYNLRPVNFDWKDQKRNKEEGRQLGLIAEEVNSLCPQLTWLDNEGKPEGVHYEWLGVPLLVEVKKLHARIEALEKLVKQ